MKSDWCYYNKYVNGETCSRIINELKSLTGPASIGLGERQSTDETIRKSKTCFIHSDDSQYRYIFDIFWKTATDANKQFFGFQISRLDFIQFAEYNASDLGEYKAHRDVFWINNDPVYHRKLSGMIQLSDPNNYVGGDFEITDNQVDPKPVYEDIRNQGTVLYIPSFTEHRVTPVTSGVRYSLVAWFEGPKWR